MITFLKKNKVLVVGLCVLGVLILSWVFFFSGPTAAPLTSPSANDSPVTQSLLVTLSNLHTITLNGAIFSDSLFISLNDFGVVIPSQTVGRRNPFAPLSGGPAPQGSAPALTLPTSGR